MELSILCDENVDRQVMEYLEAEDHTTAHVVDVFEPGIDDPEINDSGVEV